MRHALATLGISVVVGAGLWPWLEPAVIELFCALAALAAILWLAPGGSTGAQSTIYAPLTGAP